VVQRLVDVTQALPVLVLALVMAPRSAPRSQHDRGDLDFARPLFGARHPLQHLGIAEMPFVEARAPWA